MRVGEINPITLAIGVTSIVLLVIFKKYIPKVPGPLVVVVLSIVTVAMLNLHTRNVNIVGEVPGGLPVLSMPSISIDAMVALLPIALTISFVGFMESIAMAKAIAAKEKYKVDSNKELVGLGLANVGGAFFSAYPVTGGFSRSAVNYQSGARTPLASVITAILILITLLFLTDLFYFLPKAVLAAIIMVAVYSLIDIKELKYLFKIRKLDAITWIITFIATLVIGIEQGILIGVVFSLLVFIWKSAYPHMAELGYVEKIGVYRNISRYPSAKTREDLIIYRLDESLYFANMSFLEDKLCGLVADKPTTKYIILDFSAVNSIDAVSIHALEEMMENCQAGEITFLFSGVKGPVRDLLKKADWDSKYKGQYEYHTIQQAIDDIS